VSADALGTALTAGAIWTAAAVAGHFAVFHMVQVEHRARTLTLLFAGAAFATLWTCLLLDVDWWRRLYGMSVVACAFLLYITLVQISDESG
jgi:Ca2+/Na+ antiporter